MLQAARGLITAILIWGVSPALAETIPYLPPAQYDHEPRIPVRVIYVDDIQTLCTRTSASPVPEGKNIWACAGIAKGGKVCVIFMPKGTSPKRYAFLYRHERGHCNGWRH